MDQLLASAGISFFTSLATKGADAPARTFNNIWEYLFGGFDNYLIKHNKKRQLNFEAYIKSIDDKINDIKQENIQDPKLSILGPALEASKYYIDEEEIRELFAKIVSASFDKSKNSILHRSYIEIIKQLSPLDAKVLKSLTEHFYLIGCTTQIGNEVKLIFSNVLLNTVFTEIDLSTSISANNLCRLGIIEVTANTSSVRIGSNYEPILEQYQSTTHYQRLCDKYGKMNIEIFSQPGHFTPLGSAFKAICCPNEMNA